MTPASKALGSASIFKHTPWNFEADTSLEWYSAEAPTQHLGGMHASKVFW